MQDTPSFNMDFCTEVVSYIGKAMENYLSSLDAFMDLGSAKESLDSLR